MPALPNWIMSSWAFFIYKTDTYVEVSDDVMEVTKDVVLYADEKIAATKAVVYNK